MKLLKFFREITAIIEEVNTGDTMHLNFQEAFYEVFISALVGMPLNMRKTRCWI